MPPRHPLRLIQRPAPDYGRQRRRQRSRRCSPRSWRRIERPPPNSSLATRTPSMRTSRGGSRLVADLVEDVVQDVFLVAHQKLATFAGQSSVVGWLLGIARHKVEDFYRAQLREPDPLPDS